MSATAPRAAAPPAPAMSARTQQMLHAPVVSTLFRLAMPNVIGMLAAPLVIGYDGFILGRLGSDALAGVALVFPLSMLMVQMSGGGMGGATTAAVARALGGGRHDDASRLAQHAIALSLLAALAFTLAQFAFGRAIYSAMGGRGAALADAIAYSNVLFGGAVSFWLFNTLAAASRGSGNMLLPAATLLGTALLHLLLCPLLVFGWGPVRGLGVAGAAASSVTINGIGAVVMALQLMRPGGPVQLQRLPLRLRTDLLRDILRVGVPASLNPVISNASIAVATAFVGGFGTAALAGYGVAARLEYILVPIAFGFGTALTAMVATNMGAGRPQRALRVAWTGGAVVAAITGSIGLAAALAPSLWMDIFTTDVAVRSLGSQYLRIAGGAYGLFGLGLALLFASQGAGRMAWPLVASSTRLLVVAVGGWVAIHWLQVPAGGFFFVVAFSLAIYGVTLAAAIRLGGWTR
ncbi:MAG TPA: MATE family efflux transporter [Ramlibacter sp.]|nr:MATE family efflux transporter [Ramlibacter sp.]